MAADYNWLRVGETFSRHQVAVNDDINFLRLKRATSGTDSISKVQGLCFMLVKNKSQTCRSYHPGLNF